MAVSFDSRVTRRLGIEIPIANAPMGGVVRPPLVAAMAEAGGLGMMPMAMTRDRDQIRAVRELTDKPIGANIHVPFAESAKLDVLIDVLIEEGVRFVTTSTGPVPTTIPRMQEAGLTVYHVVTSLESAMQAVDAGVDGLVVEGHEGAALRGAEEIPLFVLLPLITSRIDLPVIAAGGISDGASMAAAFALGAEGVLMGTRMLASTEASIHDNYKQAVVSATETDTIVINRHNSSPLRVLRTETTSKYLDATTGDAFKELVPSVFRLYDEGDMEASFACVGMVAGRIEAVLSVADIVRQTVDEFGAVVSRLAEDHDAERVRSSV